MEGFERWNKAQWARYEKTLAVLQATKSKDTGQLNKYRNKIRKNKIVNGAIKRFKEEDDEEEK